MKKTVLLIYLIFILSCASKQKEEILSPQKPIELTSEYQTFQSNTIQLRPMKVLVLKNGLKIIYVKDDSLPMVNLMMLTKVGSKEETDAQSGLNMLTASLLEQGTHKRDAIKLADELAETGTDFSASPESDFTMLSASFLSNSSQKSLELYSDIILDPAFKKDEIIRMRSQIIAQLKKEIDKPSEYANNQMDSFLFGSHPYGRDQNLMIKSIQKITQNQILDHYKKYYTPNRSVLAVVGKFDAEYEERVRLAFEKWQPYDEKSPRYDNAKPVDQFSLRFLAKKDMKQTEIRFAQLGITRKDPDYLKLRLANEILGGSFVGRLNQRVRDDLGLTYSIYSHFEVNADPGAFIISTFTKNESSKKTIDEVLGVFEKFYKEGVTDAEIRAAKNQIIGQFPHAIETADRFARNVLYLDFYGVPMNYLTNFNQNIEAISMQDVNSVIKKYFKPKAFKVVVFGDLQLKEQLKDYHPETINVGM